MDIANYPIHAQISSTQRKILTHRGSLAHAQQNCLPPHSLSSPDEQQSGSTQNDAANGIRFSDSYDQLWTFSERMNGWEL
jgi:hypothetical protein